METWTESTDEIKGCTQIELVIMLNVELSLFLVPNYLQKVNECQLSSYTVDNSGCGCMKIINYM